MSFLDFTGLNSKLDRILSDRAQRIMRNYYSTFISAVSSIKNAIPGFITSYNSVAQVDISGGSFHDLTPENLKTVVDSKIDSSVDSLDTSIQRLESAHLSAEGIVISLPTEEASPFDIIGISSLAKIQYYNRGLMVTSDDKVFINPAMFLEELCRYSTRYQVGNTTYNVTGLFISQSLGRGFIDAGTLRIFVEYNNNSHQCRFYLVNLDSMHEILHIDDAGSAPILYSDQDQLTGSDWHQLSIYGSPMVTPTVNANSTTANTYSLGFSEPVSVPSLTHGIGAVAGETKLSSVLSALFGPVSDMQDLRTELLGAKS